MPVHNEEKNLILSLPSIFKLKPDEVILIFDRCTDRSLKIAEKITKNFNYQYKTRFIEINEPSPDWNYRVAYLMRYGYRLSKNDAILVTAADIILDERLKYYFEKLRKNNVMLMSFSIIPYPLDIRYFLRKIISTLSPRMGFSGIILFSKSAWMETEDEESAKKIIKAQDTHLRLSIQKKYDRLHLQSKTIHLRPRENAMDHYLRGVAYWQVVRKPLWKALFYSAVYFRPMMLLGYLHAKSKIYK